MPQTKDSLIAKSANYCVIEAPFGRLGIATELVDGSLMLSKIDYLPVTKPLDRKSTRLNSSHSQQSRMPSSA